MFIYDPSRLDCDGFFFWHYFAEKILIGGNFSVAYTDSIKKSASIKQFFYEEGYPVDFCNISYHSIMQ